MSTNDTSDSPAPEPRPFDAGRFFCRHNREVEPFEQADAPATVDLKQETVLRVLEAVGGDPAGETPGCEELMETNRALARLTWAQARTDFYRQRRGRRGAALVRLSWDVGSELLADDAAAIQDQEREADEADMAYIRQRVADDGAARIGPELFDEVMEVMSEAQRVRRQGRGSGGMSGALRVRILRLRKKTGLPLDTRLL